MFLASPSDPRTQDSSCGEGADVVSKPSDQNSLQARLVAAVRHLGRLRINDRGRVMHNQLVRVADEVGEPVETVADALEVLRVRGFLIETEVAFEGIEPVVWWTVHPQLA